MLISEYKVFSFKCQDLVILFALEYPKQEANYYSVCYITLYKGNGMHLLHASSTELGMKLTSNYRKPFP